MSTFPILVILLLLSVFLVVFSISLKSREADIFFLLRHPGLGLRAFASMYLIVPIVAIAIAYFFQLNPAVKVALFALSLSPVPPLVPLRQLMTGSQDYVLSLLILSPAATIIVAPLGAMIAIAIFGQLLPLNIGKLLLPIALTVVVPLVAGRITAQFISDATANSVSKHLLRGSLAMIMVGAVLILIARASELGTLVGNGTLLAMLAMVVAGLAAGFFLAGGPEYRMPLAFASSARHPGVAIATAAALVPEETQAVEAILLYLLVTTVAAAITLVFYKKAHKTTEKAA